MSDLTSSDLARKVCTWDEFLSCVEKGVLLVASDDLGGHFGFVDEDSGTWYLIPIGECKRVYETSSDPRVGLLYDAPGRRKLARILTGDEDE